MPLTLTTDTAAQLAILADALTEIVDLPTVRNQPVCCQSSKIPQLVVHTLRHERLKQF
jgi:hypothetical protein